MHGAERPVAHARDGLPAMGEVGKVVSGHVGRARPVGDKFTFYHTGESGVGLMDQLLGFRDSLRDYGRQCPLPKTWREAFRELRSLIESSKDDKKVVFIDEMPWMDTPRSKFLPALEHFWNSWGSARKDLVMIVCGSASTWIIKNVLKNCGGLHNRITDQIHLLPFTLRECEELTLDAGRTD